MTPLGVVESTNGFQVNMIPLFPYWSFPLEITWHTRQPPEPQAAGPRQQDRPITTGPETTPFLHHAIPSAERAQLQQTSPYIRLSEGFWEVLGYMFSTTPVSRRLVQTSLLESNAQLPEIGIHMPTTGRWKLEAQNPTSKFTLPELGLQLPISKS